MVDNLSRRSKLLFTNNFCLCRTKTTRHLSECNAISVVNVHSFLPMCCMGTSCPCSRRDRLSYVFLSCLTVILCLTPGKIYKNKNICANYHRALNVFYFLLLASLVFAQSVPVVFCEPLSHSHLTYNINSLYFPCDTTTY